MTESDGLDLMYGIEAVFIAYGSLSEGRDRGTEKKQEKNEEEERKTDRRDERKEKREEKLKRWEMEGRERESSTHPLYPTKRSEQPHSPSPIPNKRDGRGDGETDRVKTIRQTVMR